MRHKSYQLPPYKLIGLYYKIYPNLYPHIYVQCTPLPTVQYVAVGRRGG
jgi:hypothetical protein